MTVVHRGPGAIFRAYKDRILYGRGAWIADGSSYELVNYPPALFNGPAIVELYTRPPGRQTAVARAVQQLCDPTPEGPA